MRNLMLSVALVSSSLLTACGGGLGGDVQAISQVAITSNPAFDGYLRNDGTDFDGLPVAVVGDSAANQFWRGYFRFSLASIPAGAQVTGARLRLTRIASVGAPLGTREIELRDIQDSPDAHGGFRIIHKICVDFGRGFDGQSRQLTEQAAVFQHVADLRRLQCIELLNRQTPGRILQGTRR